MNNRKLTKNQKRFVDEYLIDLNATRAYKAAYKSVKKDETAAVNGSRLLRNAKVRKYIDEKMKEREKRTEITQDKVLKELAKIGFANATDFVNVVEKEYLEDILDEEGNVIKQELRKYKTIDIKATDKLDKDKQAAIAGIKETQAGIEVKLNDKLKALELIGRHLGMFNDKLEVKGDIETHNPLKDLTTEELKKLIE